MAFAAEPESTQVNFMEKETKVQDDFLAGLDKEISLEEQVDLSDDLFPEETTEEVTEVKEVVEEATKRIPYFKDEKVQRFIKREIEKGLKDIKPTATETFKQEVSSDPDLVSAWSAIIGNDTPEKINALKALERSLANVDERAMQKAVEKFEKLQTERVEKEAREIEEARNEIEEGFDDIENHYGISLNDRQKEAYRDFLIKIEPKGGYQEYPDFVETFEVFKNYVKANRPSNAQAKSLASRGMQQSSSTDSSQEKTFVKTDGKQTLWQKFEQIKDTI